MQAGADVFKEEGTDFEMKIDDLSLLKLISDAPVAAIQFFKIFFTAFLEVLVGVPPPSQTRTVPLHHPSREGVFTVVTDISAVNETNGRSSAYFISAEHIH